jgi:hypothetical protein
MSLFFVKKNLFLIIFENSQNLEDSKDASNFSSENK